MIKSYISTGVKATRIKRLHAAAVNFVMVMYRRLRGPELYLISQWLSGDGLTDHERNAILRKLNGKIVRKHTFMQLAPKEPFSDDLMEIILALLAKREMRIIQCYFDIHATSDDYEPRKVSYFFSPKWLVALQEGMVCNWSEAYYVFLTIKSRSGGWLLLVLDNSSRTVYLVDPMSGGDCRELRDMELLGKMSYYVAVINRARSQVGYATGDDKLWTWKLYPHAYFGAIEHEYDSGMCVFASMYYMIVGCPLSFRASDMDMFRTKLAYWIAVSDLPY
jgi:hypothetical protein